MPKSIARPSYRKERVAKVLMEALARILNKKDFQWGSKIITLSRVKMSGDLRVACVYFRCIEQDKESTLNVEELNQLLNAHADIIRRQLAAQVYLRYLPELRFQYDRELGWVDTTEFAQQLAN